MKKSMFFGGFLLLALFPAYLFAQEIQLPTVEIKVSQDKVPLLVKEAVLKDFGEGHKPISWVTTQSLFNTDEWEQSTNVDNMEVYNYGLHTKTNTGCSLDAVYTADGKLIKSREYLLSFTPELNILLALKDSEFKDWVINGDFHIIKSSSKGIEKERYALIMKNGNEKKTVYFDTNGRMTNNKKGELADLYW